MGKYAWACNFTKIYTLPWVFFTFFKWYKWYQIVQSDSYVASLMPKDKDYDNFSYFPSNAVSECYWSEKLYFS